MIYQPITSKSSTFKRDTFVSNPFAAHLLWTQPILIVVFCKIKVLENEFNVHVDIEWTPYQPFMDKCGRLADHLSTPYCPHGFWMTPSRKYTGMVVRRARSSLSLCQRLGILCLGPVWIIHLTAKGGLNPAGKIAHQNMEMPEKPLWIAILLWEKFVKNLAVKQLIIFAPTNAKIM